ncbi:MAG: 4Fe-4S binding protein, partial [Acidobacteria bacterium]|nr:4Fe-4S binding protein [Acidobacteriota bacterium]
MSEAFLIWLLAGTACSSIALFYFLAFRRRNRLDRKRLEEAKALGIDRPMGQFPYIDPAICIGCGGCIKACPEKDVLGMVGGLAAVVNGVRCLGISQCEKVCPVGA